MLYFRIVPKLFVNPLELHFLPLLNEVVRVLHKTYHLKY